MFKKGKIFSFSIVIKKFFSDVLVLQLTKKSFKRIAPCIGVRRNLRAIEERQGQQYTLLQEQTKILQNLQNEIQSLKGIIEKMPNLPGAEPGREKMSSAFYPAETEKDLDDILKRAVQVSFLSSLKK